MSGLYVKLDVEYASDDKMIAAGPMGELLYIRSLAFCKKNPTSDGRISTPQLAHVGVGIPNLKRHANRLCEVGAWTATSTGWVITAWLKRNRSSADIQAQLKMASDLGVQGNHDRWHTGPEGKPSAKCVICIGMHRQTPSGNPTPTPSGNPIGGSSPKEEEEEEPKEEEKPETEPKEKEEPSSSSSDSKREPTEPEEEEPTRFGNDDLAVMSAMTTVADKLTQRNANGDAFSYRKKVYADQTRWAAIRDLHTRHPNANGSTLAAMHLGTEQAQSAAHVPLYEPPPPYVAPDIPKCGPCGRNKALLAGIGCPWAEDMRPSECIAPEATIHPIRGAQ